MIYSIERGYGKAQLIPGKAATTFQNNSALVWDAGVLKPAPAATEKVDYVSMDEVVNGAGENANVRVIPAAGSNIEFTVDTAADTDAAQLGKVYELSTALVVDNATESATANGFLVEKIVGGPADRKLIGKFI